MAQIVTEIPRNFETRHLLTQSSFVDERHKIVYIDTPKVASTSIKYMLRSLVTSEPVRFLPYDYHTAPVMRIHVRDQMPFPTLGSFTGKRIAQILSDPGWFRFCVVRHPYDRFFSAWRDKIFLVEPGFETYQLDKTKKYVEFFTFAEHALKDDPRRCDIHWRLQVSLLLPDFMNYTHIYDLSRVSDLVGDLTRHLAGLGVTDKTLEMPRSNESWSIRPDGFLTRDITARLRDYYHLDFERFKFCEREPTAGAAMTAASLVNEYTNAIYDRNRVIMDEIAYYHQHQTAKRAARFLRRKIRYSGIAIMARSLLAGGAQKRV